MTAKFSFLLLRIAAGAQEQDGDHDRGLHTYAHARHLPGLHRDIQREMAFHIEERVDELTASGMREEEARKLARRQFGNTDVVREQVHQVDALTWLESVVKDVGFALRSLRARPMFTFVAVLSLALGIGANTSIFSLINAVMLRHLPVPHPEELVRFVQGSGNTTFTYPLWEQVRERQEVLAGVFACFDASFDLSGGGQVHQVPGAFVSGGYFGVLGVVAAAGRLLDRSDDTPGSPPVAVLGHGFWQREYGGDPGTIGSSISLSGISFRIIGVTQPGFTGIQIGEPEGIFVPLQAMEHYEHRRDWFTARSTWFLDVLGRMERDATLEQARNGITAIQRQVYEAAVPIHWTSEEQEGFKESTLELRPAATGVSSLRNSYGSALLILLVVVGTVLLIACANVAQLLLVRATARHREIAVRQAIGATRLRLVRQMLTESLLLASLGAGLGLLFARWSGGLMVGLIAQSGEPVTLDLSLDLRVLGFTIGVAALTGILFGLVPALRGTRAGPRAALSNAGRTLTPDARHRLAKGLVAGQVALSLVLVVSATLLVGSFSRVSNVEPGFSSQGVLVVGADWSRSGLTVEAGEGFYRRLLERMRSLPGVQSAAASLMTPIGGSSWNDYIQVDGLTRQTGREALAWFNGVTEGYLETLGTRLLKGRDFTAEDRDGTERVILVNQTFVGHFLGEIEPLGARVSTLIHDEAGPLMRIVGVVEDAKYGALTEDTLPTVYLLLDQDGLWGPGLEFTLRIDGAPTAAVPWVTAVMEEVDPRISLTFRTLREQVAVSLSRPRLLALLSGFFGALALLLAVIGLQGTMSFNLARRRHEIGVRIALGAARSGILGMVARETALVVGIGVAAGVLLSLGATRLIESFLFGVTPHDPATLALSALLLGGVAMAAGMLPAWRAAVVDPMEALRQE